MLGTNVITSEFWSDRDKASLPSIDRYVARQGVHTVFHLFLSLKRLTCQTWHPNLHICGGHRCMTAAIYGSTIVVVQCSSSGHSFWRRTVLSGSVASFNNHRYGYVCKRFWQGMNRWMKETNCTSIRQENGNPNFAHEKFWAGISRWVGFRPVRRSVGPMPTIMPLYLRSI